MTQIYFLMCHLYLLTRYIRLIFVGSLLQRKRDVTRVLLWGMGSHACVLYCISHARYIGGKSDLSSSNVSLTKYINNSEGLRTQYKSKNCIFITARKASVFSLTAQFFSLTLMAS